MRVCVCVCEGKKEKISFQTQWTSDQSLSLEEEEEEEDEEKCEGSSSSDGWKCKSWDNIIMNKSDSLTHSRFNTHATAGKQIVTRDIIR